MQEQMRGPNNVQMMHYPVWFSIQFGEHILSVN